MALGKRGKPDLRGPVGARSERHMGGRVIAAERRDYGAVGPLHFGRISSGPSAAGRRRYQLARDRRRCGGQGRVRESVTPRRFRLPMRRSGRLGGAAARARRRASRRRSFADEPTMARTARKTCPRLIVQSSSNSPARAAATSSPFTPGEMCRSRVVVQCGRVGTIRSRQCGLQPGQAGGGPAAEPEHALRRGDGDRLVNITDGRRRAAFVGERFTA